MKFRLKYHDDAESPPIEGAVREKYSITDTREVDDPSKIDFVPAGYDDGDAWWYSKGRNHRVVDGRIARELDLEGWFVEVPDLAALLDLVKRYGEVKITRQNEISLMGDDDWSV